MTAAGKGGGMIRVVCLVWITLCLISLCLASTQEKRPAKTIRIGVVTSGSSSAHEADQRGFEKGLAGQGYKDGASVVYVRETVKNITANADRVAQELLDGHVALIHTIGTPVSRVLARRMKIPIVFSAVTDPVGSGIVPRKSLPGSRTETHVTGVTDRWPIALQFGMFLKIVPKARKWGTLYDPGDAVSAGYMQEMRRATRQLGIELIEAPASSKSEAIRAAHFLAGRVHAIHLTADRTALSSLELIVNVCNDKKIPLFTGDVSAAARGGLAAYGLDYYNVGLSAAWRAERILRGQKPGEIPWGPCDAYTLIISEKAARAQGIAIPPAVLKMADKVLQ
jgi:putative tryptophan/tyrosine transport system substrate-binding protein